jgi:ElaB/YqjD/DUF883 family membrane-anchored ribosome-binding protein
MIMEKNTSSISGQGNGQHAHSGANETANDMHRTIDKVSSSAQPAVDRLTSGAHAAVDRMSSVAADASETLSRKGQELREAQERLMISGRERVRENPATAIAIAIAVGFLLSKLLGRSRA